MVDARRWTVEDMPEIYEKYRAFAIKVCKKFGANDRAEDCAQDAFVKLLQHFGEFRGESDIASYIYRICMTETLMKFRKASYRYEILTGLLKDEWNDYSPMELRQLAYKNKISMALVSNSTRHNGLNKILVQEVLAKLPKGYKKALLLHDVLGYEHGEIAEIVGYSDGTSKSQLSKCKERARAILSEVA